MRRVLYRRRNLIFREWLRCPSLRIGNAVSGFEKRKEVVEILCVEGLLGKKASDRVTLPRGNSFRPAQNLLKYRHDSSAF
jgi:hypothetical protein